MILLDDLSQLYLEHPTVSTDTRRLSPGCIFFALKGANFDGNRYARQALEAGAAYAVLDEPEQLIDERTLLVEDSLKALQQLGCPHEPAAAGRPPQTAAGDAYPGDHGDQWQDDDQGADGRRPLRPLPHPLHRG